MVVPYGCRGVFQGVCVIVFAGIIVPRNGKPVPYRGSDGVPFDPFCYRFAAGGIPSVTSVRTGDSSPFAKGEPTPGSLPRLLTAIR